MPLVLPQVRKTIRFVLLFIFQIKDITGAIEVFYRIIEGKPELTRKYRELLRAENSVRRPLADALFISVKQKALREAVRYAEP